MVRVNVLPKDFIEHLVEDYSLETILEMNDLEPATVLEFLINEGMIDLTDLYLCMEMANDD